MSTDFQPNDFSRSNILSGGHLGFSKAIVSLTAKPPESNAGMSLFISEDLNRDFS